MSYILTFLGGMFVGIVFTTILLCKKNLEAYKAIEQNTSNSFAQNLEAAKAAYKAEIDAYENGYEETDETESVVEEADEDE